MKQLTQTLLAAATLGFAVQANGAVIFQQSFDYDVADDGNALSTFPEFSGSSSFQTFDAGTNLNGTALSGEVGGSALYTGFAGSRTANSVGTSLNYNATDVFWFSAVFQVSASTSSIQLDVNSTSNVNTMNLLLDGGSASLTYFDGGAGDTNNFVTETLGSGLATSTSHLFLIKVDPDGVSGANSSISAWLNPSDTSSEANLGAATFTDTDSKIGRLSETLMSNYEVAMSNANTTDSVYFDEFRIATSFNDIVNVPEPSAALLIGLSGIGLAMLRRRRS